MEWNCDESKVFKVYHSARVLHAKKGWDVWYDSSQVTSKIERQIHKQVGGEREREKQVEESK